jgi:hypothetical protein
MAGIPWKILKNQAIDEKDIQDIMYPLKKPALWHIILDRVAVVKSQRGH